VNPTLSSSLDLDVVRLGEIVEGIRCAGRVPGVAIAVVAGNETVFVGGFGYRDLHQRAPVDADTIYPIASTTKSINAALLGMLVDEGKLSWDAPIHSYLPWFRLKDPLASQQVTLRDLVTMRTGLPRHDWLWMENPIDRAAVAERLRHLDASAGFRERFQYNNLTVTTSGYIAEVVTGKSWEDLVQERILTPLGMLRTGFAASISGNCTLGYHENDRRELLVSKRLACEVTGPSGGVIHSSVNDMTRWISFNLNGGRANGKQLISPHTFREIQLPQMTTGNDPSARKPNSTYAIGWSVDTYNGCRRISHGGYLHDVHSEVALFPRENIGIVSFVNFGAPMLALLVVEHVFDLLMGLRPVNSVKDKLAEYENSIVRTREHHARTPRKDNTAPSHSLGGYAGRYVNPAYGAIDIALSGAELVLVRGALSLRLEHWHFDAWVVGRNDLFAIHAPHAFDPSSRILFETDADGEISGLSIALEPAVRPIVFSKGSGI
jgi:CubicO group peptidase (beta-lactamase class C family)